MPFQKRRERERERESERGREGERERETAETLGIFLKFLHVTP
jgi:hypothetical protein